MPFLERKGELKPKILLLFLILSVAGLGVAGDYLSYVETHTDETSADYFSDGDVNAAGNILTAFGIWGDGATFSRNTDTGELTWVEDLSVLSSGFDVATVPPGRFLYMPDGNFLRVFDRAPNGSISLIQTLEDGVDGVDGLADGRGVCVAPDGTSVYTVANSDDAVAVFSRDVATGLLTFVEAHFDTDSGVDGLDGALSVAISPDGAYVYVGAATDDAISIFSRNATNSSLSYVGMISNSDSGVSGLGYVKHMILPGVGTYLYAAGAGLTVLARDASTGALSFVETHPISFAYGMAADPKSTRIFVSLQIDDSIKAYEADPGTGMLTEVDEVVDVGVDASNGVPGLDGVCALWASHDGASLYAGSENDTLVVFSIGIFGGDFEDGDFSEWDSASN